MILAALTILLLGAADFLCGWRKVVLRNDLWVPLVLAAGLWLAGMRGVEPLTPWAALPMPACIAVAASFAFWRAFGWDALFGGSMTPRGVRQSAATFARHLLIFPIALVVPWWTVPAFAAWATALACLNTMRPDGTGRTNSCIEFARCAGLGLMIVIGS